MGFSYQQQHPYFRRYDWSQVTTVAWQMDPELLCLAHRHQARVVLNAGDFGDYVHHMASKEARARWIAAVVDKLQATHMDGINFDLEMEMAPGSELARQYAALVRETAQALHQTPGLQVRRAARRGCCCEGRARRGGCRGSPARPRRQVSVDVAWSPYDVDGRSYEWRELIEAADLVFVMVYDVQSQMLSRWAGAGGWQLAARS
jgi:di-N-acetylchitobiase